jgi:hypothetical protein
MKSGVKLKKTFVPETRKKWTKLNKMRFLKGVKSVYAISVTTLTSMSMALPFVLLSLNYSQCE